MDISTSPEGRSSGSSTKTETTSASPDATNAAAPRSAVITALGSKSLDQVCAEHGINPERLRELIEQEPAIDAARVVDLHRRITTGQYKADDERIAEKLLNQEKSL